jgi:hypothetical protein
LVQPEDREEAFERIGEWLQKNGRDYIKICDPYFRPQDLGSLKLILSINPKLHVTVVTSLKPQPRESPDSQLKDVYRSYWKKHFSDQSPPRTEFVIVGGRADQLPEHDRWWLTDGAGLRFGGSLSVYGQRSSEISELTTDEVAERLSTTDAYINRTATEQRDQINLSVFRNLTQDSVNA